ncbi:hypothetical protein [uncultured Eubacterium sp.]|uniref:hypothetical protein n=1 Tax=uncultured Eubacterium sp. TaxID=165185 RepID=UPI0025991803|nr:hypothetical protein [uncultured Eubacterium sp.]
MENFKNEIYENLGLSEKTQERIVNAMENAAKSNLTPDTDYIRRIKSMRKNTHSDILNKVAVASLSIGLSCALIAGIMAYTKDTSSKKTNVAKETVKTTEKTTKSITKETSTINENEQNNKEELDYYDTNPLRKYSIDKTFKKIEFCVRTSITKRVIIGYNTIELFYNEKTRGYEINVKHGKSKFVNVDKIDVGDHFEILGYYAYGNAMYYFDVNGLKKLDLKSLKSEHIMKFNDVKLVSNDQYLFGIDDNHIYMSCVTGNPGDSRDSTEWTGQNNYMYSYNTKTKELNLLKNRDCYAVINDTYVITSEYNGEPLAPTLYVEKIEDGKVTTIEELGKYAKAYYAPPENPHASTSYSNEIGGVDIFYDEIPVCELTENGVMFSKSNDQKFYYENYESLKKDGTIDYSQVTVMSYDLSTNKSEKLATINVKSIHDSDKYFSIDIITDDYCDINLTPGEDDDMQRIKYYYKTGKIEKLN